MFDSAGSGGWVREIVGKGNFAKGSNLRLVCEFVEVPSRLIRNFIVLSMLEKGVGANENGFRSSIYDL